MTLARLSPREESLLVVAFVALACVARFIHLGSDPKFEFWIGYVTDEGRWVEAARNFALFGDPRLYGISRLHLALGPSFQAVNYVVFELAGVSFWSARIWTAACGAAIMIVWFLWLRRIASRLPLYLGLAILAFDPLVLSLSRVAIPEVPSLLFTFLAFIAICASKRRVLGAAIGGLLTAAAISMKLTTLPIAPVFLLMAALSGAQEPARQRLLRSAAFLLGVLIPAIAGVGLMLTAGITQAGALGGLAGPLLSALDKSSLYTMVARLVASPSMYSNVNLLLLGTWVCSWMLIFRKEYRGTRLGTIFEMSGIWAASWFVFWGTLDYTPRRYSVHCILPLATHLVAGLSLWRSIGTARVLATINALRSRWGIAILGWLVLPTAVILSASIVTLAGQAGLAIDRVIYRVFAIAAVVVVLAVLARAARSAEGAVTGFIALAVAAALLDMTIDQLGVIALSSSLSKWTLPVVELAILAGVARYIQASPASIASMLEGSAAKALLCALALVGLLLQSAPVLLQPTYSIRDASRDLARRFPGAAMLNSSAAGSLLLETRIPYREGISHAGADGLLVFDRRVRPGQELELATTYRLAVHPRYYLKGNVLVEGGAALVDVYRSAEPPGSSDAHPLGRK